MRYLKRPQSNKKYKLLVQGICLTDGCNGFCSTPNLLISVQPRCWPKAKLTDVQCFIKIAAKAQT